MKINQGLKIIIKWFARRSVIVVSAFIFAIGGLLIWFIFDNSIHTTEWIIIRVAAITAFFSFISSISTLLQAVETQKQREDLERPYVTGFFEGTSNGAMCFIINNSGNSPAQNIRIKFDPSPIDFAGRPLQSISLFSNPITFLPEGQIIRQIIDSSFRFFEEGRQTKFSITIKYQSVFGNLYRETIEHDLEYLKQTTLPRKTTDDYLKNISNQIEKLTNTIKEIQRSKSFPIVLRDDNPDQSETINKNISNLNEQWTIPEKIVWAVTQLSKQGKLVFTRKDVRDILGITQEEMIASYYSIIQAMREDHPGGAPKINKKYIGFFKRIERGQYQLTDYGRKIINEP